MAWDHSDRELASPLSGTSYMAIFRGKTDPDAGTSRTYSSSHVYVWNRRISSACSKDVSNLSSNMHRSINQGSRSVDVPSTNSV